MNIRHLSILLLQRCSAPIFYFSERKRQKKFKVITDQETMKKLQALKKAAPMSRL